MDAPGGIPPADAPPHGTPARRQRDRRAHGVRPHRDRRQARATRRASAAAGAVHHGGRYWAPHRPLRLHGAAELHATSARDAPRLARSRDSGDLAAQPSAHLCAERARTTPRGDALRHRHRRRPGNELHGLRGAGARAADTAAAARAARRRRHRRLRLLPRSPPVRVRAGAVAHDRARRSPTPMSRHADVFIIGAGPAGLTTAYCLTKETPSVVVIEKDPVYVGGISRTVRYKDFLFDIGGHRFFSKSKEVVDLWQEILPDDFIARPRLSRIYYGGKFYSYPLSAFEALRNLGLFTSAACMLSYARARATPIANPKSFHEWVRNQFGERLFQIFFETYTEKVWGMSCDEISADWAAQRIKGLDLRVAVMNALKRSLGRTKAPAAGGDVVKTLIETFQYPRKGPGMMWDAAAAKVRARGGEILMGHKLHSLQINESTGLWTLAALSVRGQVQSWT